VDGEVVADQPVVSDLVTDEPDINRDNIPDRAPMVRRVSVEEEREIKPHNLSFACSKVE